MLKHLNIDVGMGERSAVTSCLFHIEEINEAMSQLSL